MTDHRKYPGRNFTDIDTAQAHAMFPGHLHTYYIDLINRPGVIRGLTKMSQSRKGSCRRDSEVMNGRSKKSF